LNFLSLGSSMRFQRITALLMVLLCAVQVARCLPSEGDAPSQPGISSNGGDDMRGDRRPEELRRKQRVQRDLSWDEYVYDESSDRGEYGFSDGTEDGVGGLPVPPDLSMAGLKVYAGLLRPIQGLLRVLFGVGLLLFGRNFGHVILFVQAFKVSAYPIVYAALSRVAASYRRYIAATDPHLVYPWTAIASNVDPQAVSSLLWGSFAGATACIGATMSPVVGATYVGLSLGQGADQHVQPFIREQLSRLSVFSQGINNVWVSYAVRSASQAACVAAALANGEVVSVFSGALIGSHILTELAVRHAHSQIRRFAKRSDHALLQKAAAHFNPQHKSVHAIKYGVAVLAFMSQLRHSRDSIMPLPFRLVLSVPLAVERGLKAAKEAMLTRQDGP